MSSEYTGTFNLRGGVVTWQRSENNVTCHTSYMSHWYTSDMAHLHFQTLVNLTCISVTLINLKYID